MLLEYVIFVNGDGGEIIRQKRRVALLGDIGNLSIAGQWNMWVVETTKIIKEGCDVEVCCLLACFRRTGLALEKMDCTSIPSICRKFCRIPPRYTSQRQAI